jgi:hypothetical protein
MVTNCEEERSLKLNQRRKQEMHRAGSVMSIEPITNVRKVPEPKASSPMPASDRVWQRRISPSMVSLEVC